MDRRLGAGLLLLCLIALAVVVWHRSDSAGGAGSGQAPRGAQAQPRQVQSFALLRTSPEGLPATVQRTLGPPVHGMRPELAQRLPVRLHGNFWVVPGDGYLCFVAQLGGTAGRFCGTTANALRHGAAGVFLHVPGAPWFGTPGKRLIVGVAPDGARAVIARTHGAASRAAVVAGGVFTIEDTTADPPDRLTVERGNPR